MAGGRGAASPRRPPPLPPAHAIRLGVQGTLWPSQWEQDRPAHMGSCTDLLNPARHPTVSPRPPPPQPYSARHDQVPPTTPTPPRPTRSCRHNTQNRETTRSQGLSREASCYLPLWHSRCPPTPHVETKRAHSHGGPLLQVGSVPLLAGAQPQDAAEPLRPPTRRGGLFRLRVCPLHSAWGTATSGEGFRAAQGVRALRQRHCKSTAERWAARLQTGRALEQRMRCSAL